jgi:hypothetical protein
VDKFALVSSTPPSALAQHRITVNSLVPHLILLHHNLLLDHVQSTTTRSSSPSSSVASILDSSIVNQLGPSTSSLRYHYSSFKLPETSISTVTPKTNGKNERKRCQRQSWNFNNNAHGYLVKIFLHLTCPAIPSQ